MKIISEWYEYEDHDPHNPIMTFRMEFTNATEFKNFTEPNYDCLCYAHGQWSGPPSLRESVFKVEFKIHRSCAFHNDWNLERKVYRGSTLELPVEPTVMR